MKTIILFRHGKSDWNAEFGVDHERPLSKRGEHAARAMGEWLRRTGQVPDHLVTSSAVRARTTLGLAKEAGAWESEIHIAPELYEASGYEYIAMIRQTPAVAESVLLTGHEPACSMATSLLSGGGLLRFPTGAMARIDLEIDSWADAGNRPGQLIWLVPPKFI